MTLTCCYDHDLAVTLICCYDHDLNLLLWPWPCCVLAQHDKEWEKVEKDRFAEFDVNKDGQLNFDEIKPWVLTDNREEAEEEAEHLMKVADENNDSRLTEREVVAVHEEFVGSQVTDYGHQLHFVRHVDEL